MQTSFPPLSASYPSLCLIPRKHGHNIRQKLIDAQESSSSKTSPDDVDDTEFNPLDAEPDPFVPVNKPVPPPSPPHKTLKERSPAKQALDETPFEQDDDDDDSNALSRSTGAVPRDSSGRDSDRSSDPPLGPAAIPKPFIWYCGTLFFVVGSILNFISFSFAAQSLLSALGSTQFISNVFFGKVVLGEEVTMKTVIATSTIIGGNAMVVYFSSHASRIFVAQDLLDFYDTDFNTYLLACLCAVALCRFFYSSITRRIACGEAVPNSNLYLPLLYAITSAILGTQSVVQAKCLSILLRATLDGDNQLVNWFTYFVLLFWLGATSFWLTRMNKALSMFDGLFIIPVLQVFWTFFSIVSGGIYFEEFKSFTWPQMIGFCAGVCVVFIGVYMLSPKSQGDAQSLGDDATGTQRKNGRNNSARGYSWDKDDVNQRMVNIWTTSTDDIVAKVLDNDPLAAFERQASEGVEKAARRVTLSANKGGQAVRKFSSDLINFGEGSGHQL